MGFIKKGFQKMNKKEKNMDTSTEESMENILTDTPVFEKKPVDNETVGSQGAASDQQMTEELRQQLADQKDKYLRLFAEFENYRKRTIKEKIDFMKVASQDTLSALLPVLDDFDRAKKNAELPGSTEPFSEGIQLVYHKLISVLKSQGLEAMESNGQPFNPEFHEAVTEIPAPTEEMKGKVIDTIEKGYFLHDKIIRYAKVVVGK